MRAAAAILLAAALSACLPIMQMRPDQVTVRETDAVVALCAARASGDMDAVADLFVPEMAEALRAAAAAGTVPPLQSGAGGACAPDRVWYWGGSRWFAEVRYADRSDALDMWRSGQGRISDLIYGDGSGTLSEKLGVESGTVPPPASLLRR
jgi:hypothetical protein